MCLITFIWYEEYIENLGIVSGIVHSFFNLHMSQDETHQNNSEEEYVPPGKRLITPADVMDLDPEMTVHYIYFLLQ